MSDLKPGIMVLDKGLNLQTSKILSPPGSIFDTLNYEQVDFQGQKRIDGYARYDGRLLADQDSYIVLFGTGIDTYTPGDLLFSSDGFNAIGVIVGQGTFNTNPYIEICLIDHNFKPKENTATSVLPFGQTTLITGPVISSYQRAVSVFTATQDYYARLLEINNILRGVVVELPGPIAGLHWFRDRLYAVAGVITIEITYSGSRSPKPDDVITSTAGTARIIDVDEVSGNAIISISAMNIDDWIEPSLVINHENAEWSGVVVQPKQESIASFFQSRTEQQTWDETSGQRFGWDFIHLGWAVNYENGTSLFGSLPSLNQNILGLGVQGPTSVGGNNGRPLILSQKVSISGKPTQVNGWKTSTTPATYNLDDAALTDIDTTFIYADAFIQWKATGEVSAPGLTTPVLPEYPATNTVVVEGV